MSGVKYIILFFSFIYSSIAFAEGAVSQKSAVSTITNPNKSQKKVTSIIKQQKYFAKDNNSNSDTREDSETYDVNNILKSLEEDQESDKDQKSEYLETETNFDNNSSYNSSESAEMSEFKLMPFAEIIVINKITTKREILKLKVGNVKFFGNLSIEVHKCVHDPNIYNPNNMMLFTIFDNKLDDDKLKVFHGWMMSNNLSVSTLEHPVYEVIPVKCAENS